MLIRDWTETQDIPYREEEELRIDAIQDAVTVPKMGKSGCVSGNFASGM